MLHKGMIHIVASGAQHTANRPPVMGEAFRALSDLVGLEGLGTWSKPDRRRSWRINLRLRFPSALPSRDSSLQDDSEDTFTPADVPVFFVDKIVRNPLLNPLLIVLDLTDEALVTGEPRKPTGRLPVNLFDWTVIGPGHADQSGRRRAGAAPYRAPRQDAGARPGGHPRDGPRRGVRGARCGPLRMSLKICRRWNRNE